MKTIVAPNGMRILIEDEQQEQEILPDIQNVEEYWKEQNNASIKNWSELAPELIAREEEQARKNILQNRIFELEQLRARNIATDAELTKLMELKQLL